MDHWSVRVIGPQTQHYPSAHWRRRRPVRGWAIVLSVLVGVIGSFVLLYLLWQGTSPKDGSSVTSTIGLEKERRMISEIELLLQRLDFDPGPVDGILDEKTIKAISQYQESAGLTADGKPSEDLLIELREILSSLDAN
ncbi:MAG: peptidoglycan-binding protein [Alphaproteobacteria bacterium]|nr:peptidoglycan-binding protein [Alphaproteobacteria bacterium]